MVFYLPTALVVLQVLLAALSWVKPSRPLQASFATLSALACFYLVGFVFQTPWALTWQVVLWLALGGVQVSFVVFTFFGGQNLWKISALVQPLMLPFMFLAAFGGTTGLHAGFLVAGIWLQAHVVGAIIANGVLAMAGVFAFAIMTRQAYLKAHATSAFVEKLPPLDILERAQTAALYIGAAFLTLAVLAGAAATHEAYGVWAQWGVKNISTLLMLVLVVVLIVGKQVCGVRGRHGAQVMMAIYFLMLIIFLLTIVAKT